MSSAPLPRLRRSRHPDMPPLTVQVPSRTLGSLTRQGAQRPYRPGFERPTEAQGGSDDDLDSPSTPPVLRRVVAYVGPQLSAHEAEMDAAAQNRQAWHHQVTLELQSLRREVQRLTSLVEKMAAYFGRTSPATPAAPLP